MPSGDRSLRPREWPFTTWRTIWWTAQASWGAGAVLAFERQPAVGLPLIGLGLALIVFVWSGGLPLSVARYYHRLARIAPLLATNAAASQADQHALGDEIESVRRLSPPDPLRATHHELVETLAERLRVITSPASDPADRARMRIRLRRQTVALTRAIEGDSERQADRSGADGYHRAINDHVGKFEQLTEARYRQAIDRVAITLHHLAQIAPPANCAELHGELTAALLELIDRGSRARLRMLADDEVAAVAAVKELSDTERRLGDVRARINKNAPKVTLRRLRLPAQPARRPQPPGSEPRAGKDSSSHRSQ